MGRRHAIAIDERRRMAFAELEGLTTRMNDSFGHVAFALDAHGDYDERDEAENKISAPSKRRLSAPAPASPPCKMKSP